jgi:hypothetical protein
LRSGHILHAVLIMEVTLSTSFSSKVII